MSDDEFASLNVMVIEDEAFIVRAVGVFLFGNAGRAEKK